MLLLQFMASINADIAFYQYLLAYLTQARAPIEAQHKPKVKRKYRKKRCCWVRPWLSRRTEVSQYKLLMEELRLRDEKSFKNYTRMNPDQFFEILNRVQPRIEKTNTKFRKSIPPGVRLAVTLRFYATGNNYKSLSYGFRVAPNTISIIVTEVTEAIIEEFSEELLSPPITREGWLEIADKFEKRWNMPHALGAVDGKHVAITCPPHSGSAYYNYKGFFSIVMLAVVDADYKFIWVEAGANGSCSDAQIWNESQLLLKIQENKLQIPQPEPIVEGEMEIPYFLLGDDAFAMKTYLLKPHSKKKLTKPERIFNYRLSRGRRIVENAFGILANRFRCLLNTMRLHPDHCTSVILACCCLHNFLRLQSDQYLKGLIDEEDENHEFRPAPWRDLYELTDGQAHKGQNCSDEAKKIRDYLTNYFVSPEGAVTWQDKMITLRNKPK